MMKILCISNYYPPFFEGGYEISVQESMDYLETRGHQVFVLCGSKGSILPQDRALHFAEEPVQRKLRYIDYHHPSFLDKHKAELHNYLLTAKAIKALKPDLVYFGNQKAISIAPALAVQKLNIPHIYDIGDDWLKTYAANSLKKKIFQRLKCLLPFFVGGKVMLDPVIVPSRWMASELRALYGSRKVHVIPRAIALPPENTRELLPPLRFVFAGRIEPLKGLDILINAARMLHSDYPDFSVDIYGEEYPHSADTSRALIERHGLKAHFNFRGKSQNMQRIFPQYDIMIMPTLARETFGRVIIEAMASGLIVIATNAFGPAEIIEHQVDSLLFERANPAALAACIKQILSTPLIELELMRKAARKKVAEHYEISLVKKSIEIILEREIKTQTDKEATHV